MARPEAAIVPRASSVKACGLAAAARRAAARGSYRLHAVHVHPGSRGKLAPNAGGVRWYVACCTSAMNTSMLDLPSRAAFIAQHRELDKLFEHVLAAFEAGDRVALTAIWTVFENAVTCHMDGEELRIFPSFRLVDPEEADRLLAEHRSFRNGLTELGIATDLHLARLDSARQLVERLRAHVVRENALSYRAAASS